MKKISFIFVISLLSLFTLVTDPEKKKEKESIATEKAEKKGCNSEKGETKACCKSKKPA